MRCYLDTSAAAKLLVEEAESDALVAFLERAVEGGDVVGSSRLLETELRRLAIRVAIPQEHVTLVLERLDLLVPDDEVFRTAGLLPGASLRSLDALHVAAALRWGAYAVMTYDERRALAARAVRPHAGRGRVPWTPEVEVVLFLSVGSFGRSAAGRAKRAAPARCGSFLRSERCPSCLPRACTAPSPRDLAPAPGQRLLVLDCPLLRTPRSSRHASLGLTLCQARSPIREGASSRPPGVWWRRSAVRGAVWPYGRCGHGGGYLEAGSLPPFRFALGAARRHHASHRSRERASRAQPPVACGRPWIGTARELHRVLGRRSFRDPRFGQRFAGGSRYGCSCLSSRCSWRTGTGSGSTHPRGCGGLRGVGRSRSILRPARPAQPTKGSPCPIL